MKNKIKLIVTNLVIVFIMLFVTTTTYAHSGRTDSNGGHKDKNNVSGLGSYHYHCGGYPAHLHTNGVCQYKSSSKSSRSSSSSSSTSSSKSSSSKSSTSTSTKSTTTSSTNKTTTTSETIVKTIDVDSIDITNENSKLKVGDSIKLSATVLPENATNKDIKWSSSDESIVKVDAQGNINILKVGIATITATTNNSKTDSVEINAYTLAESIELISSINSLKIGNKRKLDVKVTPTDAEYKLKWSSDNEESVQVINGEITAIKPGKATITVETDNGKTDSIEIIVPKIEEKKEVNNDTDDTLAGLMAIGIIISGILLVVATTVGITLWLCLRKKKNK